VPHAGTFNNNITSMAAGVEVMANIYTAEVAARFTERGDELRENIAQILARYPLALCVSGSGTMMAIHARAQRPTDGESAADKDPALQEMVFLGLLRRGIYIAPRGMINLSLPVTDDQLATFLGALDDVCQELAS
jgi:glutamate-1-semialdehyde 2,1-aminomutase